MLKKCPAESTRRQRLNEHASEILSAMAAPSTGSTGNVSDGNDIGVHGDRYLGNEPRFNSRCVHFQDL